MLNNKGQSLVLFVIMIPVLLLFMALVIDLGRAYNLKNNLDSSLELVIEYGLDNYNDDEFDKNELNKMLKFNNPSSDNNLVIDDDKIRVSSSSYVEGIFARVLNIKVFKVESEYVGYIDDGKKMIERIK